MPTKTNTPKPKKKSDELLDVINDPAGQSDRTASALIFTAVGLVAILFAWWYWGAVLSVEERPHTSFLAYAATIALVSAGVLAIVGAVLTVLRKIAAVRCIDLAAQIALPSFIIIAIGAIINFFQNKSLGGLSGAWNSFVDFNRVEIGSTTISISTTLTILIITLSIIAAVVKNNKEK